MSNVLRGTRAASGSSWMFIGRPPFKVTISKNCQCFVVYFSLWFKALVCVCACVGARDYVKLTFLVYGEDMRELAENNKIRLANELKSSWITNKLERKNNYPLNDNAIPLHNKNNNNSNNKVEWLFLSFSFSNCFIGFVFERCDTMMNERNWKKKKNKRKERYSILGKENIKFNDDLIND